MSTRTHRFPDPFRTANELRDASRRHARGHRFVLLALIGLLALFTSHGASALTPPSFAPPYFLFATTFGTCNDTVSVNTHDGGNGVTITVYAGQSVSFSANTMSTISWNFGGLSGADATGSTINGGSIIRTWLAGAYAVTGQVGAIDVQTINVVVLPEIYVPVRVTITADNTYVLGSGGTSEMTTIATVNNADLPQIVSCDEGPETYTANMPLHGFIYVAAWSDDFFTQGVLGQFRRISSNSSLEEPSLFTGDSRWRVFATGIDYDGLPGPTTQQINDQIALANQDLGAPESTSIGWVGDGSSSTCFNEFGVGELVAYEKNDDTPSTGACGNAFDHVCNMSWAAKWMWYDLDADQTTCAFTSSELQREYLIFRLPVSALPSWMDLGGASSGDKGPPHLFGDGSIEPGSVFSLSVTDGQPNVPGALAVAVTSMPVPFKGGVLKAFPIAALLPVIITDASGAFSLQIPWPASGAVPPGLSLYFQALLLDPTSALGIVVSNAVVSPPTP